MEEGERCTKYFFVGLERKHISNNSIKQLKRENDTPTSSNAEILEEQYNFYKKNFIQKIIYLKNLPRVTWIALLV